MGGFPRWKKEWKKWGDFHAGPNLQRNTGRRILSNIVLQFVASQLEALRFRLSLHKDLSSPRFSSSSVLHTHDQMLVWSSGMRPLNASCATLSNGHVAVFDIFSLQHGQIRTNRMGQLCDKKKATKKKQQKHWKIQQDKQLSKTTEESSKDRGGASSINKNRTTEVVTLIIHSL